MSDDDAVLAKRKRLAVIAAELRGIQLKDLVDAAVSTAETDQQLLDALARPPLDLHDGDADVVLSMPVRNRGARYVARLRAEMAALTRELERDH